MLWFLGFCLLLGLFMVIGFVIMLVWSAVDGVLGVRGRHEELRDTIRDYSGTDKYYLTDARQILLDQRQVHLHDQYLPQKRRKKNG